MSQWDDFLRQNLDRQFLPLTLLPESEQPVQHEIYEADGVYIRQISVLRPGTMLPQHAHVWDHLTMVAVGAVRVWKDGVLDGDYRAPHGIFIKAGVKHAMLTLEPQTVLYCVHALHGVDKAKVLAEHHLLDVDAL